MAQNTTQTGQKIREQTTRVNGKEYTRFVVDYGKDADKRRIRRTFKSREAAEADISKTQERTEKIGRRAKRLTDKQLHDAAEALTLIGKRATLKDAVQFWLDRHNLDGENKTVRQPVEAYEQNRIDTGRRPDTIRDLRCHLAPLTEALGDMPANHVTEADLKAWMKTQNGGAVTKKKRRRHLVGLFNFGIEEKYCAENPAN